MIDTRLLGRKDIEFILKNLQGEDIKIERIYSDILTGKILKKDNEYVFYPSDKKFEGKYINLKGIIINLNSIDTIHASLAAEEKVIKLLTLKKLFKEEKDIF
jgi:transcriptional regulator with GAF, ATPase, and Fis domain